MSVSLHQCPRLRLILLYSGGQVGKTWEPSNKPTFFRISWEHCAPYSLHFHLLKYLRVSSPHDSCTPSQIFKSQFTSWQLYAFPNKTSRHVRSNLTHCIFVCGFPSWMCYLLQGESSTFLREKMVPIYNKWVYNPDHQNPNYCPLPTPSPFLDAFEKLQKATISFVMCLSVRPSVCPNGTARSPLDGFSNEFDISRFF
jgi:hypothetical protein